MPRLYVEKLKKAAVLIGHERCAAMEYGPDGTIIMCAVHSHGLARSILTDGRTYQGCRECIEEHCEVVAARTEDHMRGPWEDLGE
jgi:hypothetical protein